MDEVGVTAVQLRFFRLANFAEHMVGHVFHFIEVCPRQAMIMGDVQSAAFHREMRTCLENMWSQKTTCSTPNNVDRGVVVHQLLSSLPIKLSFDGSRALKGPVGEMDDHIAYFLGIENNDLAAVLVECPVVPFLSTAFRIEQGRVQNNGVG